MINEDKARLIHEAERLIEYSNDVALRWKIFSSSLSEHLETIKQAEVSDVETV